MTRMYSERARIGLTFLTAAAERDAMFAAEPANFTTENALRVQRQLERCRFGRARRNLAELIVWSRAQSRARQTHPGKRGKR